MCPVTQCWWVSFEMETMKFFIFWATLCFQSCIGNEVVGSREKRIIFGAPLLSSTHYDVTGFYVRIDDAVHLSWLFRYLVHPGKGKERCGGAALTPHVVQTACHCIAAKWSAPVVWETYEYEYPIVINGWENMMILHHGHQTELQMNDGVWSRKFIVHENCRKLQGSTSHDIGWIVTREELKQSNNVLVKYSFAPLYTQADIVRQYNRNMKRELICLYVGFGSYYYEQTKPTAIYAGVPTILQHGWRTLRNYWQCYIHTELYLQDWYGRPFYASIPLNYSRDGTWACTTFFGKERAITGPGDSGGPVSCGGVYFGLVQSSQGDFISESSDSWEYIALIAFAIFENAAEYREAMEHHLWAIWGRPDEPVPGVLGRSTINPFNPDAFYSTVVPFDQE